MEDRNGVLYIRVMLELALNSAFPLYDVVNIVMSVGWDRAWLVKAVRRKRHSILKGIYYRSWTLDGIVGFLREPG